MIFDFLDKVDSILYYPILIIVMALAGLYFTIRTRGVQIRLLGTACKLIVERPEDAKGVSPFQALMVSTASRVGTGNIVGVSTAICLGGPGALFWMWIMAIVAGASAFVESTLAQVYKKRDENGDSYGGPAYYIEEAVHSKFLAIMFSFFLIATYAVGFNMLCAYNLQDTFSGFEFYDPNFTPMIIGLVLMVAVGFALFGGGNRILSITEVIVPFMGVAYVIISLIIIIVNFRNIPAMFGMIFSNAFDFSSIAGGVAGSCLVYGIKRGLYSNEAGVGSAPNAAASASVTHPVKQGLVQTVSVYIDTILLCTATGLMCLASGTPISEEVSGAQYVQNAVSTLFGSAGPIIIVVMMILFAFTTLIGNLYYVRNALAYLNNKKMPSKAFMNVFHIFCVVIIFLGAMTPVNTAWALADIFMGGMTIINIPCCVVLGKVALGALKDFEKQKKEGKNPEFHASSVGIQPGELDYWD